MSSGSFSDSWPNMRRTRASSTRTTRVSMGLIEKRVTPNRSRRKSESELSIRKRSSVDGSYRAFCAKVIGHSKRTLRNITRSDVAEFQGIEETNKNLIKRVATLTEELHQNQEEICLLYDCLQKKEEDHDNMKEEMNQQIEDQNEQIEQFHQKACDGTVTTSDAVAIPQCFVSGGQELEPLQQTKSLSRGKGSFACCVPFTYRGTQVCVKSFFTGKAGTLSEEAEKNMLHEASILLQLKDSVGLPKLMLVISESTNKYVSSTSLVLTYHGMDGQSTTLQRILDNPRVYELSNIIWIKIAVDVCNVLESIHNSGIIHADLKSENVIVDDNYQPVIIDFGRSCLDSHAKFEPTVLDPAKYDWVAPEVCLRVGPHSYNGDIYSLGTLLLDINNQARVNSVKLTSAAHLCHHRAEFRPTIAKVRSILLKETNPRLMCKARRCRFSL